MDWFAEFAAQAPFMLVLLVAWFWWQRQAQKNEAVREQNRHEEQKARNEQIEALIELQKTSIHGLSALDRRLDAQAEHAQESRAGMRDAVADIQDATVEGLASTERALMRIGDLLDTIEDRQESIAEAVQALCKGQVSDSEQIETLTAQITGFSREIEALRTDITRRIGQFIGDESLPARPIP